MNRTDVIRLDVKCRQVREVYEPQIWSLLMKAMRPKDYVVEVGAHVGLYTIALASRCPDGCVTAFEPDGYNRWLLERNLRLNARVRNVKVVPAAIGSFGGLAAFSSDGNSESHLLPENNQSAAMVACLQLDTAFPNGRVDVLKIDVEGYEEHVLRGADRLLSDGSRRPRLIFIEVHPYAWEAAGTTSDGLIQSLRKHQYSLQTLGGEPVEKIAAYGHILAYAPQTITERKNN